MTSRREKCTFFVMNAAQARQNFYQLIQDVNDNHEPVVIDGKRGSAVLISVDDWRSIQETLYLNAIPGMVDSIQTGMKASPDKLASEPGW